MLTLTIERERAGLSKSELARRAGMALADICKIESGQLTVVYPNWRRRLAEALNVAESELFEEVSANGQTA